MLIIKYRDFVGKRSSPKPKEEKTSKRSEPINERSNNSNVQLVLDQYDLVYHNQVILFVIITLIGLWLFSSILWLLLIFLAIMTYLFYYIGKRKETNKNIDPKILNSVGAEFKILQENKAKLFEFCDYYFTGT